MRESIVGVVPASWELTTLGELCIRSGGNIQTGPFGSQLHAADYVPVGVPSVMPQNIGDNVIVEDGIARITPEDAARLGKYQLATGDIVYSRRGDVERRALVRPEQNGWLCGTGCLRVRPGSGADSRFISYYLGHPEVRTWIVRHAIGATMPNLNTKILSALPVALPSRDEQAAIADLLGALDDKIAVNERIVATCREVMLLTFRAALTANAVPRLVSEVADFHNRKRIPLSGKERMERPGPFPYYGAAGVVDHVDDYLFQGPHVLVGEDGTVITETGAPVVQYVWGRFWVNNHAHVLTGSGISSELLSVALLSADVAPRITGAVQPKLSMGNLKTIQLLIPSQDELPRLELLCEAAWSDIRSRTEESRTLAELRDTLLSKLISGDLRIKSGERLVSSAV